jgi:NADH-quinone oxidoreductase subunit N
MTPFPDLQPVIPELIVGISAILLLMLGVFRKADSTRFVSWLGAIILIVAAVLEHYGTTGKVETFGGQFVVDGFARFSKILVLLGSAIVLVVSTVWLRRERAERVEFPVLIMFATLGMLMMISANNLISLYLSLELQSLSLYVLAAFQRDNSRATEAGLKYFVLGSLASGMLLYGASMVYGFAGTTSFDALGHAFGNGVVPVGASPSAWCSSWPALPSRSRRCRSICGHPTSTRARPLRSPRCCPSRPRSRRWRCWCASWSSRSAR